MTKPPNEWNELPLAKMINSIGEQFYRIIHAFNWPAPQRKRTFSAFHTRIEILTIHEHTNALHTMDTVRSLMPTKNRWRKRIRSNVCLSFSANEYTKPATKHTLHTKYYMTYNLAHTEKFTQSFTRSFSRVTNSRRRRRVEKCRIGIWKYFSVWEIAWLRSEQRMRKTNKQKMYKMKWNEQTIDECAHTSHTHTHTHKNSCLMHTNKPEPAIISYDGFNSCSSFFGSSIISAY